MFVTSLKIIKYLELNISSSKTRLVLLTGKNQSASGLKEVCYGDLSGWLISYYIPNGQLAGLVGLASSSP